MIQYNHYRKYTIEILSELETDRYSYRLSNHIARTDSIKLSTHAPVPYSYRSIKSPWFYTMAIPTEQTLLEQSRLPPDLYSYRVFIQKTGMAF